MDHTRSHARQILVSRSSHFITPPRQSLTAVACVNTLDKIYRLGKEQVFYNEEKQRQQKRIDAMVAKDPENYDIKKQVNKSLWAPVSQIVAPPPLGVKGKLISSSCPAKKTLFIARGPGRDVGHAP